MMKMLPLLCGCLLCGSAFAAEPIFRAGILTDTHISDNPESLALVKQAFRLFHQQNPDLIVNVGDMAERHIPDAYRNYRAAFEAEFADGVRPKDYYVLAAHDTVGQKGYDAAFAAWKETLRVPHEMYEYFAVKGYPVIIVPQNVKMAKLTEMLDQAVKDYPGMPIFVFDHVPACHTTDNTDIWGGEDRREVYNRYPNAIQISGHTHGSLRDELNVWQGEFTEVSAGSLTAWQGLMPGCSRPSVPSYEVLLMEVYPEKVLFRRFDVRDGREIAPEAPWCIPLPFDAKSAPYNRATLYAKSVAPEFAPDATLSAAPDAELCRYWTLTIPETAAGEAHTYEIELYGKKDGGDWEFVTYREILGNFHQSAAERAKSVDTVFNSAYLSDWTSFRAVVTPRGFFGKRGKAIAAEFAAPKLHQTKVLFECNNPMTELPLTTEDRKTHFAAENGVYALDDHAVLNLPDVESALPPNARLRITLDFQITAAPGYWWTMSLHRANPHADIQWRTTVGDNHFRKQRLSLEFVNSQQTPISLLFYNGIRGKAVFHKVKIEEL